MARVRYVRFAPVCALLLLMVLTQVISRPSYVQSVQLLQPLQLLGPADVGAQTLPDLTFANAAPDPNHMYYVAMNGNDTNDGRSLNTAWRHIGHALKSLQAGDAAYVYGGPYDEGDLETVNAGRADAPIWLMTAPGQTGLLRGGGVIDKPFIRVTKPYWIIEGLEIDASGSRFDPNRAFQPAIAFQNTHHVLARRIDAHGGSGPEAILFEAVTHGALLDSKIHDTHVYTAGINSDSHGVLINVDSENILIKGNESYNTGGDSLHCIWGPNDLGREDKGLGNYPKNITIEGNIYHEDVENAVDIKSCRNVTVRKNQFYGYRPSPFTSSNNSPGGAAVVLHFNVGGALIEKNRIWDSGVGVDIGNPRQMGPIVIRQNVIRDLTLEPPDPSRPIGTSNPAGRGEGILVEQAPTTIEIYHNTIYNLPNDPPNKHFGYGIDLGNTSTISKVLLANNIIANPVNSTSSTSVPMYIFTSNIRSLVSNRNIFSTDSFVIDNNGVKLADWKRGGQDKLSVIADPGFRDPGGHDFGTQRSSPARDSALPFTGFSFRHCSSDPDVGAVETCEQFDPSVARQDSETYRFFTETKHSLVFGFKAFWERSGGLPIFGYPMSEELREHDPEHHQSFTVQYLERQRLEWHPENAGTPYEVIPGLLGVELLESQGRVLGSNREPGPRPGCLWFPDTDHNVCNLASGANFMTFWSTHGAGDARLSPYQQSLLLFGMPLTQAEWTTDRTGAQLLVQWFERARFEYHPELTTSNKVLLGHLGTEVRSVYGP